MTGNGNEVAGRLTPENIGAMRLALARISLANGVSLQLALQSVAEIAVQTLAVNRLSIWRYADELRAIVCECLFQPAGCLASEGMILHARDFPNYFRALHSQRVLPISDTEGDPVAAEFRAAYFTPLNIRAMLDAPIYEGGHICGVVCHEQIGTRRGWTAGECEFAGTVADTVARLHQEASSRRYMGELSAYQSRIAALHRLDVLGRLAAGMAHDFSNVLLAITGFAEEIREASRELNGVSDLARQLVHATSRGTHLVQQLRALSRQDPARPRVIDLRDAILDARAMLERIAGRDVPIRIDLPAEPNPVFFDPDQMERILINLVLNARDAMPGGGSIAVALVTDEIAHETAPRRMYAKLSVSDTGCGMDEVTRRRMFEPLFTTKGEKGTGLGLAIVDQAIAEAGGFVTVDSVLGEGTRVHLFLPRAA